MNLPVVLLGGILQRMPALPFASGVADAAGSSSFGFVLRTVLAGAAALGGIHSLAGATQFVQSPGNPVTGTVGQPLSMAFTITGSPTPPIQFSISGALPAGLRTVPALQGNTIRSGKPEISGTPTQAGRFTIVVTGSDGVFSQQNSITFEIAASTGTGSDVAPAITAQPVASQSAIVGESVSFTVTATGTPAPTFQWRKDGRDIAGATAAILVRDNVQGGDAGLYSVVITNSAGSVTSNNATLAIDTPAGGRAPLFTVQPASQTITSGSTVVFNALAPGAVNFQWRRNGVALAGTTRPTLVLNALAPDAGTYTCIATNNIGAGTISANAVLDVVNEPDFGRLINLSISTNVSASDPFFTLGTVIGGGGTAGTKPLLLRAVGPGLGAFGVPGTLVDPKLDLFSGAQVVASNDNWGGSAALATVFAQVGAFGFDLASRDAAVFNPATLAEGYTVQVAGVGGATGAVLAELYDATPGNTFTAATPRLVNVSVRKQIGAAETLTAGFVIGGKTARTVLIRAIGPGLAAFGVTGTVPDPRLTLFSGNTAIAENDNWGGDPQLVAAGGAVGAFAIADTASRDAMLLVTLPQGNYTAQVSGGGGGGAALVEVYEVP